MALDIKALRGRVEELLPDYDYPCKLQRTLADIPALLDEVERLRARASRAKQYAMKMLNVAEGDPDCHAWAKVMDILDGDETQRSTEYERVQACCPASGKGGVMHCCIHGVPADSCMVCSPKAAKAEIARLEAELEATRIDKAELIECRRTIKEQKELIAFYQGQGVDKVAGEAIEDLAEELEEVRKQRDKLREALKWFSTLDPPISVYCYGADEVVKYVIGKASAVLTKCEEGKS